MLSYDGKKIIPAPLVQLQKEYKKTTAGDPVGTTYRVTLRGTLLPFRGSPSGNYADMNTAFWQLSGDPPDETYAGNGEDFDAILRKQEAIRWLFREDGKSLEWQPIGGQPVVKCNPRVADITFNEGTWADRCEYEITLQADLIYINGAISVEDTFATDFLFDANEQWTFEEQSNHLQTTYSVTHSVSAKGVKGYDELGTPYGGKEAWEHAKVWVDARVNGSVDSTVIAKAVGGGTWVGGSYTRAPSVDIGEGSYVVVEKWVIAPSTTYSDVTMKFDRQPGSDVEFTVTYDGTIYGIAEGQRTGNDTATQNAVSAVPTYDVARNEILTWFASSIGGLHIPVTPRSRSVVIQKNESKVSFTFVWEPSDNDNADVRYEAQLVYDKDTGDYTLSLKCDVTGLGDTSVERLANAKAAVPSDTVALAKAKSILSGHIPADVVFNNINPKSRSIGINETKGIINLAWAWETGSVDYQISVSTVLPNEIVVEIPIPGRTTGPIMQDMNTVTSKNITVSLTWRARSTKPTDSEVVTIMDGAAGLTSTQYYMTGDQEVWTQQKRLYTRSRKYLVREAS